MTTVKIRVTLHLEIDSIDVVDDLNVVKELVEQARGIGKAHAEIVLPHESQFQVGV